MVLLVIHKISGFIYEVESSDIDKAFDEFNERFYSNYGYKLERDECRIAFRAVL